MNMNKNMCLDKGDCCSEKKDIVSRKRRGSCDGGCSSTGKDCSSESGEHKNCNCDNNDNNCSCGKNLNSDSNLGILFHQVTKLMVRETRSGSSFGCFHKGQGRILSLLTKNNGSLSQKEILDVLDIRSGSLSELLIKLEGNGLLERAVDASDKRGFIVSITEKGKNVFNEHRILSKDALAGFFVNLSDEEKDQLKTILNKLILNKKSCNSALENQSK